VEIQATVLAAATVRRQFRGAAAVAVRLQAAVILHQVHRHLGQAEVRLRAVVVVAAAAEEEAEDAKI
jgi:hypothetical protein